MNNSSTITNAPSNTSLNQIETIHLTTFATSDKAINSTRVVNEKEGRLNSNITAKSSDTSSVASRTPQKLAQNMIVKTHESNLSSDKEIGKLLQWPDLHTAEGEHGKYVMVKKKPKKKKYKKIKMEVYKPKMKYKKIKMKVPVKKMKKKKVKGYMVKKHHY